MMALQEFLLPSSTFGFMDGINRNGVLGSREGSMSGCCDPEVILQVVQKLLGQVTSNRVRERTRAGAQHCNWQCKADTSLSGRISRG